MNKDKYPFWELRQMNNGKLPAYAWPGGYPVVYYFADGEVCCSACARGENDSIASEDQSDPQWRLVGYDVLEDVSESPVICSHCGTAAKLR